MDSKSQIQITPVFRNSWWVIVEKNSLIKSFTNIDRSVWGLNTLIGSNVAIDSHVLIGHDVTIGDNVQIRGSIIAGFFKIGQNTIVGIGSNFTKISLGKTLCRLQILS